MDQVEQFDPKKGQPFIDQNATPTSAHLTSEAGFIALWAATPFVPALLLVNVALSPFSIPNTYILIKRAVGAKKNYHLNLLNTNPLY